MTPSGPAKAYPWGGHKGLKKKARHVRLRNQICIWWMHLPRFLQNALAQKQPRQKGAERGF